MSLKYFHLFFIAVSIMLCLFFGFWCLDQYRLGDTGFLYYGIASFFVGVGLIFYGNSVLKKFRDIGFFTVMVLMLLTSRAWSCATCAGDPDNPASKALTASVLFLLGVIVTVLILFAALAIYYNRRSKILSK